MGSTTADLLVTLALLRRIQCLGPQGLNFQPQPGGVTLANQVGIGQANGLKTIGSVFHSINKLSKQSSLYLFWVGHYKIVGC